MITITCLMFAALAAYAANWLKDATMYVAGASLIWLSLILLTIGLNPYFIVDIVPKFSPAQIMGVQFILAYVLCTYYFRWKGLKLYGYTLAFVSTWCLFVIGQYA